MAKPGDYDNPAQNPGGQRIEESLRELELKVHNLYATVGNLSGVSTVENVLEQGLRAIHEQLAPLGNLPEQFAPLRALVLDRPQVPPEAVQTVADVLRPMERPKLAGIGSLGIQEANVPFIGQAPAVGLPLPPGPLQLAIAMRPPGQNLNQPLAAAPNQQALGGGIRP